MSHDEEAPKKVGRPKKDPDSVAKERTKSFLTRNRRNTALYEIYVENGGEVPQVLKGLYTTPTEAQKAAEHYKNTRRKYY